MKKFFQRKKVQIVTPAVGQDTSTVTNLPASVHIPWQRITVSLFAITIVFFQWRWATNHLYSLQPTALSSFTTITVNSQYVVAALAIFFATGKLIYDWKNSTVSQVIQQAQTMVTETIVKPKHFDGPDIT